MKRLLALMSVIVVTLLSTTPALAAPEDVANDVASNVMSPYCPGVTLHDCPSDAAADLRAQIVRWAEQGMSRDEIIDRLETEFGDSVRAAPPASGVGLLAWLLPLAAVGVGLGLAWLLIGRWNRTTLGPTPTVSPQDQERVAHALDVFRSRS